MITLQSWKVRIAMTLGMLLLAAQGFAQTYPNRPVRMLIPYAPGGAADILARIVAKELTEMHGQSYVVENKGGAGGTIAAAEIARAAPDGYQILLGAAGPIAIAPAVYGANVGFHPTRDLTPVTLVTTIPLVLVTNMTVPVKTVGELIAYAKAQPGKLNYGSSGTGGPDHLATELFKSMAGISMTHVPYKGSGPAMNALMAREVELEFVSPLAAMPLVDAGKMRLIGVSTKERLKALPNAPAIGESLPGFEVVSWQGFFVPAGTPPAIVNKLSQDIRKIIAKEEVQNAMRSRGLDPVTNTPQEFAAFVRADVEKWGRVVKEADIKP